MTNYKEFIEENVEIFPNQFKFGSFVRYEHCLTACEMAATEASKNFVKPVVSGRSKLLLSFFLWFRANGELYVDKPIEEMIAIYEKESNSH